MFHILQRSGCSEKSVQLRPTCLIFIAMPSSHLKNVKAHKENPRRQARNSLQIFTQFSIFQDSPASTSSGLVWRNYGIQLLHRHFRDSQCCIVYFFYGMEEAFDGMNGLWRRIYGFEELPLSNKISENRE